MLIKEFMDSQWVDYADYDNRRSLPNIIDGFKTTHRKALYTAVKMPKNADPMKVSQFASKAAAETAYHHGEASMMSAVTKLAQDFPGTNNFPLLERHGQFGSRLSPDPSSPRYILTRLHDNWDKFFKKEDQNIVEFLLDDNGDSIEPKFYIPVVPMLLLNGTEGMGNGFSTDILNYGLPEVIKGIKELIKHGEVKTALVPKINGFTGSIEKADRQVIFKGTLDIVNTTKIRITDLPPGVDNDKYKAVLNKLIEKKFIKDYKNHSTEDKWEWILDCPRETVSLGMEVLIEKLGLIKKVTENFVGWGIDDTAPMTFPNPEALLTYWYHERLKLYQQSLDHQIAVVKKDIIKMDTKIRFLKWCLKNDFRKLSKAEFITQIIESIKKLTPEWANEFVNMPIYKITTDEIAKAEDDMDEGFATLEKLGQQTPTIMMEAGLKGL